MTESELRKFLPGTSGDQWLSATLPQEPQDWLGGSKHNIHKRKAGPSKSRTAVETLTRNAEWNWPKREVVFISDLHADADALIDSLVVSGGICRYGPEDHEFTLTSKGQRALFIFGGDFFDKGPGNLRLLRALKHFIRTGARVRLLAGNHDIRILLGMRSAGSSGDPGNGHFFIRMGPKAIPFLAEIRDQYLSDSDALDRVPDAFECCRRLYPNKNWWENFPRLASWVMPQIAIDREMSKISHKVERFEALCGESGLSLREAYAAATKWQALFLSAEGEFNWFFKSMQLAHRKGSFLFVHAGLDDRTATMLNTHGTGFLNQQFKQQLRGSPFEFYYGPIANTIRTKYRSVDMPLSEVGGNHAKRAGINAIVHGHRNLRRGQRISIRKQLLHFECDVTLDSGTRKKEGLKGKGAGATLIHPDGLVLGISSDYHKVKVFAPEKIANKT